jgi:hypothetical protein
LLVAKIQYAFRQIQNRHSTKDIEVYNAMTDTKPRIVTFESFDPTMTHIELPGNCLLYRGQPESFQVLTDRPAFYTYDDSIAKSYGTVTSYVTTRPLVLLDIRLIRSILLTVIQTATGFDSDRLTLALAYGACSLHNQIQLLNMRFRGSGDVQKRIKSMHEYYEKRKSELLPLEVPGVRVAETTNDSHALMFLKGIFHYTKIDGYIAPAMYSPYHVEKTEHIHPAELVLFNPASSGIRLANTSETTGNPLVDLEMLISTDGDAFYNQLLWGTQAIRIATVSKKRIRQKGGGKLHFDPNALDKMSEEEYRKLEEKTKCIGPQLLGTRINLSTGSRIGATKGGRVTFKISPWIQER